MTDLINVLKEKNGSSPHLVIEKFPTLGHWINEQLITGQTFNIVIDFVIMSIRMYQLIYLP